MQASELSQRFGLDNPPELKLNPVVSGLGFIQGRAFGGGYRLSNALRVECRGIVDHALQTLPKEMLVNLLFGEFRGQVFASLRIPTLQPALMPEMG